MKPNFTFIDGDKVLALNRNDVAVEGVGSILDLGDGRKWNVTGLKEATYTVELVPEPVVEAPRTFPKDQPALKEANTPATPARAFPASIPTRPAAQVIVPTPARSTNR